MTAFAVGQAVRFDAGRRGEQRGVLVQFSGTRWVVRTTADRTWRVPPSMLRPMVLDDDRARSLLDAGRTAIEKRVAAKTEARERAETRLAPRAATFLPGARVEVVHRGSWWPSTVVRVEGGKVVVENPTRALISRALAFGLDDPGGHRSRTITVWANRVRATG